MKLGFKIGWSLNQCIEREVMLLPLLFFKGKDDFSNLSTWEVVDQVDQIPTSALHHANLQSSEPGRAAAGDTEKF